MMAVTRRKVEAAERVLDFVQAHPNGAETFTTLVAQLQAALARAHELAALEQVAMVADRAAVEQRVALQREIAGGLLRPLARLGRNAARIAPELVGRFPAPDAGAPIMTFTAMAKTLHANATQDAATLGAHGLPPTLLPDLGAKIMEYEVLVGRTAEVRAQHMKAADELQHVGMELTRLVDLVGVHYRYTLRDNPALFDAWARLHRTRNAATGTPDAEAGTTPDPA